MIATQKSPAPVRPGSEEYSERQTRDDSNQGAPACQSPPQYVIPASDIPDTPPNAALFADLDHLTMLAGTVIASLMEYGRHPAITITPAEMPTPGTRRLITLVHDAIDAGIKSQSDVVEYIMGHLPGPEFAAIVGDLMAISDFQSVAPKPKSCRAAVAALRAHAQAHRRWELAREILTRGSAGEDVAALVAEMHALGTATAPAASLEAAIEARIFNHEHRPEKPVPLFSIIGKPLITAGNIMNVQAPPKAGKSSALAGMMGSAFATSDEVDCLGFTSTATSGALIHIDTEQSTYDHDALVRRAILRAGAQAPPPWLQSFCLTDFSPGERRQAIHIIASKAARTHGGIRCIIIDGVGDLVNDPNDTEESFSLIDELVRLAMKYQTGIVTVLHENPAPANGQAKTRGHLGSQLERKAESNLRLAKDSAGITTMWVDRGRHCDIPRDQGPCFAWSDEKKMHVLIGTAGELKQIAANEKHEEDACAVFLKAPEVTHGELIGHVMERCGVKERAAKTRIQAWSLAEIIRKNPAGRYEINR